MSIDFGKDCYEDEDGTLYCFDISKARYISIKITEIDPSILKPEIFIDLSKKMTKRNTN